MQEAIPYKTWQPMPQQSLLSRSSPLPITLHSDAKPANNDDDGSVTNKEPQEVDLKNKVSENAVIVFGRRGCCMSHVVERLLQGLGANPAVHEIEEDHEASVVDELESIVGGAAGGQDRRLQFPMVFIGGRLFGGLDRIMATHITGDLIPILKQAGALWL